MSFRRTEDAIDPAVDEIGFAEKLHHHHDALMLHLAEFVASLVDHLSLACLQPTGQHTQVVGQRLILGIHHHTSGMQPTIDAVEQTRPRAPVVHRTPQLTLKELGMTTIEHINHMTLQLTVGDTFRLMSDAIMQRNLGQTHHFSSILEYGNPELPILASDNFLAITSDTLPIGFAVKGTSIHDVLARQEMDGERGKFPLARTIAKEVGPGSYHLHFPIG